MPTVKFINTKLRNAINSILQIYKLQKKKKNSILVYIQAENFINLIKSVEFNNQHEHIFRKQIKFVLIKHSFFDIDEFSNNFKKMILNYIIFIIYWYVKASPVQTRRAHWGMWMRGSIHSLHSHATRKG